MRLTSDRHRLPLARARHRRAVILVLVLWITVVLTVMAYSLLHEMNVSMKMTSHNVKQLKARAAARAGMARAVNDLRNSRLIVASGDANYTNYTDSPDSLYRDDEEYTDVELGEDEELERYTVRVRDVESRFNVNTIRQNNWQVLSHLLSLAADYDREEADGIAKMFADYIDQDFVSADVLNMDEIEYWTEWAQDNLGDLVPPDWEFRPKNGPLFTIEEMMSVPGITREAMYGDPREIPQDPLDRLDWEGDTFSLIDLVCVGYNNQININTAHPLVLEALVYATMGPDSDYENIAESIVELREDQFDDRSPLQSGITDLAELAQAGLSQEAINDLTQRTAQLTVHSRFFDIVSRGEFRGIRKSLWARVRLDVESYNIHPDNPDTFGSRDPAALGEIRDRPNLRVDPAVRVMHYLEL